MNERKLENWNELWWSLDGEFCVLAQKLFGVENFSALLTRPLGPNILKLIKPSFKTTGRISGANENTNGNEFVSQSLRVCVWDFIVTWPMYIIL